MQVKIIDDEFFSGRREIVKRRALFPFVPLAIIQQTEYRKLGRRTVNTDIPKIIIRIRKEALP